MYRFIYTGMTYTEHINTCIARERYRETIERDREIQRYRDIER